MRKFILTLIIIIIALGIFNSQSAANPLSFELNHADKLEAESGEIRATGHVIVHYDEATINSPACRIELNKDGEPEKAYFSENVQFSLDDRKIKAEEIIFSIPEKKLFATGNTISELKDKNNSIITIHADYQALDWKGKDASAKGNLKTTYQDLIITSDELLIIFKNEKPNQAIFYGLQKNASIKKPGSFITGNSVTFNIDDHNIQTSGDVTATVWTDEAKEKNEQDFVTLKSDDLYIDQNTEIITATGSKNKVKINYQETTGESFKAFLVKQDGKPEKIIFKDNAIVSQPDKQLSSEEVIFNFSDKRLISNTKTEIRPKTIIFKNE